MMTWLRRAWAWLTGKKADVYWYPSAPAPAPTASLQLEDGTDLLEEDDATPISLEQ